MQNSFSNRMRLGQALGLRALDRLQINDAAAIREMTLEKRRGQNYPLPFMFFQRIRADGLIEVSSPGGYLMKVAPEDVCDLIAGEPIVVQAMPKKIYLERLKLSLREKQAAPGQDCFEPAHVLRVEKDRWGRVDRVFVEFLDRGLNSEEQWSAPIQDSDRTFLNQIARRDRMPVITATKQAAGYSADKGVDNQERVIAALARTTFKCAIKGYKNGVEQLASAGLIKLNHSMLNRIYSEAVIKTV